jgi:hypothetical protein
MSLRLGAPAKAVSFCLVDFGERLWRFEEGPLTKGSEYREQQVGHMGISYSQIVHRTMRLQAAIMSLSSQHFSPFLPCSNFPYFSAKNRLIRLKLEAFSRVPCFWRIQRLC